MKKNIFLVCILLMTGITVMAQRGADLSPANVSDVKIDIILEPYDGSDVGAASLVRSLLGDDVPFIISNVIAYTGTDMYGKPIATAGMFRKGFDPIGIGVSGGVVMGSAHIHYGFTQTYTPGNLGQPGDADLDIISLALNGTFDATVIEFQFTATKNKLELDYVFGTPENFTPTNDYDDVFAFFLDGVNLARFPGTGAPMSAASFADPANEGYIIQGAYGPDLFYPFRGRHTVPLKIEAPLVIGQTYTVKMAIADGDDDWLGSYVFLQSEITKVVPLANWSLYLVMGLIALFMVFGIRRIL